MRRQSMIAPLAVALALAGGACATGTGSVRISPTPQQTPTTTASDGGGTVISPSPPPGATGSFTNGQASLVITGGVTQTTAFGTLGTPAAWSPVPGTMTLSWTGTDPVESMSVGGPSFSGQQSTSAALTLAFSVKTTKGTLAFRSQSGECTITINPATPTQVAGVVFCTNLKSVDGHIIVNVQGSFSAAG